MPADARITTDEIKARMDAVERLTKLFRHERLVYLLATAISVFMLLACAAKLLLQGKARPEELAILFGSSGLITVTAGRLLRMWSQALQLLAGESVEQS